MEIEVRELTKYYGKLKALDDVSFTLHHGIFGLLGQNGAGKSTLIKILVTILKESHGEILIDGKNLKSSELTYRNALGYMPQQQKLPSFFSVEEFLYYIAAYKGLDRPQAKVKIEHLLRQVNLDTQRSQKLNTLSGGMKQRLLIAQALLNDPQVLFLDEPTAGLDPIERRNFRKIISDISESKIIVVSTHVISDIEYIADKVMLLKKGHLLGVHTQPQLLQQTKVYESYQPIEELERNDSSFKLVNILKENNQRERVRFISEKEYEHRVSTNLDDVYLDWLG